MWDTPAHTAGLMAGITLAQAEAKLALYLAAEAAVVAKQSYSIAGRSLVCRSGRDSGRHQDIGTRAASN